MNTFIYMIAAVCAFAAVVVAGEERIEDGRQVVIEAQLQDVMFGRSVSVAITYRNASKRKWQFTQPESSLSVSLKYRTPGQAGIANGFALGEAWISQTTRPDGEVQIAVFSPPKVVVELEPGESHAFAYQLPTIDMLPPGHATIWIEDDEQRIASNHVELTVRFGGESVTELMKSVADESVDPYRRGAYRDWLRRLKPDFDVKLPVNNSRETAAERQARVAFNEIAIKGFEAYWAKEKDTDRVKGVLDKINAEAQSPPTSRPAD